MTNVDRPKSASASPGANEVPTLMKKKQELPTPKKTPESNDWQELMVWKSKQDLSLGVRNVGTGAWRKESMDFRAIDW
jgi:hypothetical protein